MKKILSMAMAFVMIVMLWGCAPKKTTEVAPIAPDDDPIIVVDGWRPISYNICGKDY